MAKTTKAHGAPVGKGKVTPAKMVAKTSKGAQRVGALGAPPALPTKPLTVFYSWQSDLPDASNRNGIRDGLRAVRKAVKGEVALVIDEATRDAPGSPNIPNKIFEKIRACDAFVADVTTITGESHKGRACANPNVTFELGYAAAHVGWDRIILLVNTAVSPLDDLPFDFDRHRVMTYEMDVKPSKAQKEALAASLKLGVELIAKHNPPRPRDLENLTADEIRRKRDVDNITWALEQVHQPTLDEFVLAMPDQLRTKVFWYFESFKGVVTSSLFHIADAEMAKLFRQWLKGWSQALSAGAHYEMTSHPTLYRWTGHRDPRGETALVRIRKGLVRLETARQAVLAKVRETYVEVDIDATNKTAFDAWRKDDDED